MDLFHDNRTVMTLDAGGTNFVFSAIHGGEEVVDPVSLPSHADDFNKCIGAINDGFDTILSKLKIKPVAISFAFPGPADYPAGIIGDLGNLPSFKGGVALGPMLNERFGIPVFINNDGDLFAYGEAIAGFLPEINKKLHDKGVSRQYHNLFGITLGTGFGGGFVRNGELFLGDNSAGAEIWLMRHKNGTTFAEEGVSIRAVKREYIRLAGIDPAKCPEPKVIFQIAKGLHPGNKQAAFEAFRILGETIGDALANAITLIDGLIVIGGGLSGASELFLPAVVTQMNTPFRSMTGEPVDRLELQVYNLENEKDFQIFAAGKETEIKVPCSSKKVKYDPVKRIGVGISALGTSKAVAIGAYAYALFRLDKTR